MATHSSTLAWQIPWMEEPGRLQSMGSLRTEWLYFPVLLSCIGEGNGNQLQCSCLENPRDAKPGGLLSMGLHRVRYDWSDFEAAESITTNKASGGDGIPVELFQILKDDAVKVLHSICQQIWKNQQWPQDWKKSVFILIPKKGNAKERSDYRTIALISHAGKVVLKILQARLQQYVNHELPDVQAGFRKSRRTRDQIANIRWIIDKAREFQKNFYFCFTD